MLRRDGILLVDKPVGPTSFGVVDKVRRTLGRAMSQERSADQRASRSPKRIKCGHAGSLDPLATGLLVLMCGRGTRLSPFLMGMDKDYTASVRFGIGTDSLDAQGELVGQAEVEFGPHDLKQILTDFRGPGLQVPPVISAIKQAGQPLYKRIRRGESVPEPEPRAIDIQRLELTDTSWGRTPFEDEMAAPDGLVYEATLEITCTSGTYVRALARDLAAALGSLGYVHALRRERVGPFSVEEAFQVSDLQDAEILREALLPLAQALAHWPALTVTDLEAGRIRRGGQPEMAWLQRLDRPLPQQPDRDTHFCLLDLAGELVAVGKVAATGGLPRLAVVFPAPDGEDLTCA